MDRLAEQVSLHGDIDRAADALGMSVFRADFLWLRICARLGEEAEA